MCFKKGCWSSKHTKKEHNKSRNWFKGRFGQQFDRKATQYIANFEGTEISPDNNLDNESLDEMKALLIDIPSPSSTVLHNENSEAFFTSFSLVEKVEKMAFNLIDRLFSHSLITIGNVLPNHINFANIACDTIDINFFAYIAIDQYLSDKFYEIIIDTGISKHFTASYKKFMAYIRDIKYTTIDISKADAIYI